LFSASSRTPPLGSEPFDRHCNIPIAPSVSHGRPKSPARGNKDTDTTQSCFQHKISSRILASTTHLDLSTANPVYRGAKANHPLLSASGSRRTTLTVQMRFLPSRATNPTGPQTRLTTLIATPGEYMNSQGQAGHYPVSPANWVQGQAASSIDSTGSSLYGSRRLSPRAAWRVPQRQRCSPRRKLTPRHIQLGRHCPMGYCKLTHGTQDLSQ